MRSAAGNPRTIDEYHQRECVLGSLVFGYISLTAHIRDVTAKSADNASPWAVGGAPRAKVPLADGIDLPDAATRLPTLLISCFHDIHRIMAWARHGVRAGAEDCSHTLLPLALYAHVLSTPVRAHYYSKRPPWQSQSGSRSTTSTLRILAPPGLSGCRQGTCCIGASSQLQASAADTRHPCTYKPVIPCLARVPHSSVTHAYKQPS